jgi:hypothetical protein
MLPSDYIHRNVFYGFQEDGLGIKLRDIIGVDNLLTLQRRLFLTS